MHRQMMCAVLLALSTAFGPSNAAAQTSGADARPPGWSGAAGGGLALTAGNKHTSTVNASYELKWDAGGSVVVASNGLLVWGKSEGVVNSDHLGLDARIERKVDERTSVFAQTQYLRDQFKSIDELFAPTFGISRQLIKDDRTELKIDSALGLAWEQNPDRPLNTDGALTAGQQLTHKLTETTELRQKVTALWKVADLHDALYTLNSGVAVSVTAATRIKLEFLDTYKARPTQAGVQKNDVSVLVSFIYKFE